MAGYLIYSKDRYIEVWNTVKAFGEASFADESLIAVNTDIPETQLAQAVKDTVGDGSYLIVRAASATYQGNGSLAQVGGLLR